jgi:MFS family permease
MRPRVCSDVLFQLQGYLCDIISRRWTLLLGALICCLGTGLTAGAQSAAMMVGLALV